LGKWFSFNQAFDIWSLAIQSITRSDQWLIVTPTAKRQVHKDNWVQLKLVILKHLPVLGKLSLYRFSMP
jgi:SPX domain protein involved in polyphosphate accumulation